MKRVIIVCEGETEQEFCNKILQEKFLSDEIYIETPLIKKSKGGIVKWTQLKKEIENHLLSSREVIVTTLIDYYGIKKGYNFPGWEDSNRITDKIKRMEFLESRMREDVREDIRDRYIPYLQLHEFEGLLFNNIDSFSSIFRDNDFESNGKTILEDTIMKHNNPEMINDSPNTCPSARLKKIFKGYSKIVYGNIIAEEIGIQRIMEKSPRFNEWVNKIIKKSTNNET